MTYIHTHTHTRALISSHAHAHSHTHTHTHTHTHPLTHAHTQNLAEDGGEAQLSQLLDPALLRLVALALACHPLDDDIANAALGLAASVAAQVGEREERSMR